MGWGGDNSDGGYDSGVSSGHGNGGDGDDGSNAGDEEMRTTVVGDNRDDGDDNIDGDE